MVDSHFVDQIHPKQIKTAFWMVHNHFDDHFELPSIEEWREKLRKSITVATRQEAFERSPLAVWEFSHVKLMVMLSNELPHHGGRTACVWDEAGEHMCSPRIPEKGIVKLAKVPGHTRAVNFKDAVFLLTRDALGFAKDCDKKQVIQICFSSQCFALDHLVLADHKEIESRRYCGDHPEIQCPQQLQKLNEPLVAIPFVSSSQTKLWWLSAKTRCKMLQELRTEMSTIILTWQTMPSKLPSVSYASELFKNELFKSQQHQRASLITLKIEFGGSSNNIPLGPLGGREKIAVPDYREVIFGLR